MPTKSLFVCTSPRSGSTLLGRGLASTQVAGCPEEWFGPLASRENKWARNIKNLESLRSRQLRFHAATTDTEYIQRVTDLGTSPNGVFGAKLHLGQIPEAKQRLRGYLGDAELPLLEGMRRAFPCIHFVWLRRKDKVAQAISLHRAIESGRFVKGGGDVQVSRGEPDFACRFDVNAIYRHLDTLAGEDAAWELIFELNGIKPLTIEYEDLVANYPATIMSVLDYVGVERIDGEIRPVIERQADGTSREWRRRLIESNHIPFPDAREVLVPWVNALLN